MERQSLAGHSLTNELSKQTIKANEFDINYLANDRNSQTLHIYLEGDGLPWLNRFTVSPDPSPRDPLALSLMLQDPTDAIYLSRPCYFLELPDQKCNPRLWTIARYSETVVDTMLIAINKIVAKKKVKHLVLIGYSGGGVLAALLAERLSVSNAYVTIAANLDIKKWTTLHQYSELSDSLNPAEIEQTSFQPALHFIGGLDKIVPKEISEDFIAKTKGNRIIIESFDHRCCWVKQWPQLLKQIHVFGNKPDTI